MATLTWNLDVGTDEQVIFNGVPIGIDGKSAYELDVEQGFTGTLQEWLDQIGNPAATDVTMAADPVAHYILAKG